jgi:hypothetical protein
MIAERVKRALSFVVVVVMVVLLAGVVGAQAATVPVKELLAGSFGAKVNMASGGSVCTILEECQLGEASSIPGGFQFAKSVAGTPGGNIYIADQGNHRVQELTATGQFVLMFGKEVNETTKGDLCTHQEEVKEGVKCKAGVEGGVPGQLAAPFSIAVDPTSGDVYLTEVVYGSGVFGERVQKFTAEGQFVLEIGKEVNGKTKGNLCTHEEEVKGGVKCTGPALRKSSEPNKSEHGSFNFESTGDLLAVDPAGTLYVGDEDRVQEFKDTGEFSGEIPLEANARVYGLAVDPSSNVYLTYGNIRDAVREFNAKLEEVQKFIVSVPQAGAEVRIQGFALDSEGHLAIAALQQTGASVGLLFGFLYDAGSGEQLTSFQIPPSVHQIGGLGFNGGRELYAATSAGQEVLAYTPVLVAALRTGSAACVTGTERGTDVTVGCTLDGEVNPVGVSQTVVWFELGSESRGTCTLTSATPKQPVVTVTEALAVSEKVEGLRPNETYCYQLAGEDQNVQSPEDLTGKLESITTQLAAPRIVGAPEALFVGASSAVLFSELNPEKAESVYFFEYAQGKETLAKCPSILNQCSVVPKTGCSGVARTPIALSRAYGQVGATLEAAALRPATEYSYRLYAENSSPTEKCATTGSERSFNTLPAPAPSAQTGGYSALRPTSAIIAGTVNPDGASVTYAFELGVYDGPNTQYGVVLSAAVAAGSSIGSVEETLALNGLQPGTTYAYRIAVSSGYIDSETHTLQGQPATFTTGGLPTVLTPPTILPQLPDPPITFPKATTTPKKTTKTKSTGKTKGKKRAKKAKRATHPSLGQNIRIIPLLYS